MNVWNINQQYPDTRCESNVQLSLFFSREPSPEWQRRLTAEGRVDNEPETKQKEAAEAYFKYYRGTS